MKSCLSNFICQCATRLTMAGWLVLMAAGAFAETVNTNPPVSTNGEANEPSAPPATAATPSSSRGPDESTFGIVAERNIFDANRSGGQVRLSSSRRPTRVEGFTLVGTMAYAKGTFAFFDGTSSEFTKTLKSGGIIAGHKVVNVLPGSVKLEADGKVIDLPIGSAIRREDQGRWHVGASVAGNSGPAPAVSRDSGSSNTSGRANHLSGRETTISNSFASRGKSEYKEEKKEYKLEKKEFKQMETEAEILKRLMERREKESQ